MAKVTVSKGQVNYYQINVSASPAIGGTASYDYDLSTREYAATATPRTGYRFVRWTENGSEVSTANPYTFTLTANRDLVAVFVTDQFTFKQVSGITRTFANSVAANTDLTLSGTVMPYNATNQTIVWSVQSAGTTGASVTESGGVYTFNATTAGTATVRATIAGGGALGAVYTQDFNITVNDPPAHVPVTNITGVPTTATTGVNLTLTGTVEPEDATNKTIVWSLKNPSLSASVTNGIFRSSAPGKVTVTATIAGGGIGGADYTQDFEITVSSATVVMYGITVSASPAGGGEVTGGGSFNKDSNRQVTATANPGYHFVRWTEGGAVVSTNASYTFTLTSDRNLVAVFELDDPTLGLAPASEGTLTLTVTNAVAIVATDLILVARYATGGRMQSVELLSKTDLSTTGTKAIPIDGAAAVKAFLIRAGSLAPICAAAAWDKTPQIL